MTSKTLQYVLYQRKVTFGKHRGKSMQVARLTGRYQVDFERFCSLVARNTTLNYMEVQSVLNLAADTARDLVSEGPSSTMVVWDTSCPPSSAVP